MAETCCDIINKNKNKLHFDGVVYNTLWYCFHYNQSDRKKPVFLNETFRCGMGTVKKSLCKTGMSALHISTSQLSTQNKFQNGQLDSEITFSAEENFWT
jgi:hypothetical protein